MMRSMLWALLISLSPTLVTGQTIQSTSTIEDSATTMDFVRSLKIASHIRNAPLAPHGLQTMSASFADLPAYLTNEDHADIGMPSDTLTEAQILKRMARIYAYQSDLLVAQARNDNAGIEDLLDISMGALSVLLKQPDILDNPVFQELYRSVVAQHDAYYGFTDSLTVQQGDIFAMRDQYFSYVNDNHRPPLETISLPELSLTDTAIPMTINERVESSIVFLLTEPDRHINNWLNRAETYFPMIEQIFREEGVPDELKYLAMIESGLNPKARSWARAVGMWQFIRATGSAYDLQINGWVDERQNPEKATRAAARHLKDLHRMFGDWQLALAGYNYSPGKLRRHIRRAEARLGRKATYWDVYDNLPRETRNYVPMFIATSIVASNPKEFGLESYTPGPTYEFDYVPVRGMLSLSEVASLARTDIETIKALNPELRSSHLPPTRSAYYVRIPLYSYQVFAESYAKLPEASKRPASHHRVRRGETLGQIARRYGVSVSALMRKNGLHSSLIHVGQNLVVPIANYSSGLEIAELTPMRIQYGLRSVRRITPNTAVELNPGLLIARAEERAAEKRKKEEKKQTVAQRTTKPAPKTQTASSSPPANSQTKVVHRVRRGDTLIEIAKKYRVTVSQIREWNNIRSSLIRIGQRLTIYQ